MRCLRLVAMSDETTRALRDAQAAETQAQQEATDEKKRCLVLVADGLTAKIEERAKAIALAQPEVTRSLGKEGVGVLREHLAQEASDLAPHIRGAADAINWPTARSRYNPISERDIHQGLFAYLHGESVNRFVAVFQRHGYLIHDDNSQRAQGILYPQNLYDEAAFGPVADAINAHHRALEVTKQAKADDARSAAEDIWAD